MPHGAPADEWFGHLRHGDGALHAVFPGGEPQERVVTFASFLIRYGAALVAELEQEVARWAGPS